MDSSRTVNGRGTPKWRRNGSAARQAAFGALLVSVGVTFDGLNSAFGGPLLFLLCGAALLTVLTLAPPPMIFWRRAAPIILLAVVAHLWALVPAMNAVGTYATPDLIGAEMIGAAALLAAFLAGACIAGRNAGAVAVDWLVVLACANVAIGLMIREVGDSLPLDLWRSMGNARFAGTVSNPNVAGAYFGMMALLALGRAVNARAGEGAVGQAVTAARWIAVLLCAGACTITASRSAVVAMLGMVVVSFVRARTLRTALLVVLGLALLIGAGLGDLVIGRIGLLDETSTGRAAIWTNDWAIVQASPWFGHGFGSFSSVQMRWIDDPRLAQELWTVNSAHNLVFQLLVEGGVGYVLLLMAAAIWTGWRVVGNLRRPDADPWRAGGVAALAVVVACAMVDIALDVPALAAVTLFLLGMLWEVPQFGTRSGSSRRT